jgi:hypothetical protein
MLRIGFVICLSGASEATRRSAAVSRSTANRNCASRSTASRNSGSRNVATRDTATSSLVGTSTERGAQMLLYSMRAINGSGDAAEDMEIIDSAALHPYLTADYVRHAQRRSSLAFDTRVSALRFFPRDENAVTTARRRIASCAVARRSTRRGQRRACLDLAGPTPSWAVFPNDGDDT